MAKSANFNSISKTLKSLSVTMDKIDKTNLSTSFTIKIDVDTGVADRILALVERVPYEARIAFNKTLEVIANDLWATLDENMDAAVWKWHGDTRDIVDTGDLRDSGKVYVDGDDIVIKYSQEYAAIVHFGGYTESGFNPGVQIYYPARPWVEATLSGDGPVPRFDFNKALEDNFFAFLAKSTIKELFD